MDISNLKEGDLDGNGVKIIRIHHKIVKNAEDWYILYDNAWGKLSFGHHGIYVDRLSKIKWEVTELIILAERLRLFNLTTNVGQKLRMYLKKETQIELEKAKTSSKSYNSIIASAISACLENDDGNVDPKLILSKVSSIIKGEAASKAKIMFLRLCLILVSILICVLLLIWGYESRIANSKSFYREFNDYFMDTLFLSVAGAVGAFISVTQKIGQLDIDDYFPGQRTNLNAYIRIALGVIFGNLLFWILRSDFIKLVDRESLQFDSIDNILLCLLVAVIGGFSERLVPDILSQKVGEASKNIIVVEDQDKELKTSKNGSTAEAESENSKKNATKPHKKPLDNQSLKDGNQKTLKKNKK